VIDLITAKQRAYADIEARYACLHETRELRARTLVDGRRTFVSQCIRCGHTSSPIGRRKAEAVSAGTKIPSYDNDLQDKWRAQKSGEYAVVFQRLAPELEAEYDAYLRSEAWQKLRKAVFARASYRCEGCQAADAEEVHHLTYIRLGHEFLTDLLAVCAPCHAVLHTSHTPTAA